MQSAGSGDRPEKSVLSVSVEDCSEEEIEEERMMVLVRSRCRVLHHFRGQRNHHFGLQ